MEPFIGEIKVFPFDFAPKGWAVCDGSLLPIAANQALFALIGTTYGGNGTTTFALPDLRGRGMIHYGSSRHGDVYSVGQSGGTETVTLTQPELPGHNHALLAADDLGSQPLNNNDDHLAQMGVFETNQQSPLFAVNGYTNSPASLTALHPNSITPTGSGTAHENRMPCLAMCVCIATTGIFPSRS